ncbi:hypothetical protein BT96DRAFT_928052 [Gymnopus androsaceus JB14]|uniref:Uncharacterized protein n=1 Tax=Gymnopus androsaceus JB14 TaxID=1447944 RepID=A0A6A4GMY9_9AGAR|nr:hypothetical protein BT96DRAFT_928052 [Gymnopus androsaceus JB14]
MSTVWFMVDDTDSRLNYTGDSWFLQQGFTSEAGPTYNDTLHLALGLNNIVSFHFNGSSNFGVYGSLMGDASVLESPYCAIECTLDGAPTEVFQQTTQQQETTNNNVLACRNIADNLTNHSSSGEHELIINVTYFLAAPPGSWSLDYITYESLADPAIDGEILQAGNLEVANVTDYSMLAFGPGWNHFTDSGSDSQPQDDSVPSLLQSNVTIKFNGTSFSLYGGSLGFETNATYKVDDLDAVPFPVPSIQAESNQLLFTASDLGIGEHSSDKLFEISYFYVTSLTKAEQQSLASSSSTGHLKSGMIMGAVLGTIIPVMLLTLVIAVVWTRRKSRQRRALRMLVPFPFISQTSHSVLPKQLLGQLASMWPTSKKNIIEVLITILVLSTDRAENNDGDRLGPQNLLTMKLEQRLLVTLEQNQQLNQQLEELTPQQQQVQAQLLTVHTDSGLRLTGEASLEEIYEVPPGYTES